MAVRDTPADTRLGFWSTGLAVFGFWNLATLIGALAGNAISDPSAFGLDAAAPAAFLALLAPRLQGREPQAIAALAAVAALVAVPLVPARAAPVMVAAAVAMARACAVARWRRDVGRDPDRGGGLLRAQARGPVGAAAACWTRRACSGSRCCCPSRCSRR